VSSGKVKIVGAVYDLHGGTVRWLGEHPQQSKLLGSPLVTDHAEAQQMLHDAPPSAPVHDAPSHPSPAAGASHDPAADPHAPSHADPHAAKTASHAPDAKHDTAAPPAKQQSMLIPAAFIVGANAVGMGIIYMLKWRHPKPAPAA
jgi:hypothetical protein